MEVHQTSSLYTILLCMYADPMLTTSHSTRAMFTCAMDCMGKQFNTSLFVDVLASQRLSLFQVFQAKWLLLFQLLWCRPCSIVTYIKEVKIRYIATSTHFIILSQFSYFLSFSPLLFCNNAQKKLLCNFIKRLRNKLYYYNLEIKMEKNQCWHIFLVFRVMINF